VDHFRPDSGKSFLKERSTFHDPYSTTQSFRELCDCDGTQARPRRRGHPVQAPPRFLMIIVTRFFNVNGSVHVHRCMAALVLSACTCMQFYMCCRADKKLAAYMSIYVYDTPAVCDLPIHLIPLHVGGELLHRAMS
jgi:hypothetical protein